MTHTKQTNKPNIVWFMVDSFRDYLLLPPGETKTKTFIHEVAERGVVFEQCVTAAPYTMASMNAIMTSFYPSVNELDGWFKSSPYDLDKNIISFTDILKAEGYYTAAFFPKRGKALLPPYSFDVFQSVKSPDEFAFEKYLAASAPKFAAFYLEEVHDACCAAETGTFNWEKYAQAAKETAERVRYFYEQCVGPNDVVVITSDHGVRIVGESTSERHKDETVTGKFLTDKTIRSFFSITFPRSVRPGTVIQKQVRTIDIAPTVLDIAGLPVLKGQGVSLLPALQGTEIFSEHPAFLVTGGGDTSPWRPDAWGVRTPQWKFIITKIKKSFFETVYTYELYNMQKDSSERNNVVDEFPKVAQTLFKEVTENVVHHTKSVQTYYEEQKFDYKKYLRARTFPLHIRVDVFWRTLFVFMLFQKPRIQLSVIRIKMRKFFMRKFGKPIL